VAGLGRADLHAERFLTALASHGEVASHALPFDDPDPGATRVAGTRVEDGTHHFTLSTPRAFFIIDHNQFAMHTSLTGKSAGCPALPACGRQVGGEESRPYNHNYISRKPRPVDGELHFLPKRRKSLGAEGNDGT